ncbi:MAG: DNA-directed RNA polymerase subunit omega [Clostridia bacterium]|nr:DNA-directed RNA polymerase subunit omega [Clostridia bacterium]
MIYPSINEIMKAKNISSKYTLVVATAKRAREINQTKVTFTECKSDKPVTIALHEIYENKINFKKAEKVQEFSDDDTIMNHILEENLANAYSDTVSLEASIDNVLSSSDESTEA